MLFYLVLYVVATLGTFGALAYVRSRGEEVERLDDLSGLSQTHSMVAAMLAVCMLSLAGIPPLAGFWGKLTLFSGAVELALDGVNPLRTWFTVLAIVGALNAAIAAAYYLRVIRVMYFQSPRTDRQTVSGPGVQATLVICSLSLVFVGANPGRLLESLEPQRVPVRQEPIEADLRTSLSPGEDHE